MARLFVVVACFILLSLGTYADKEYEEHSHDHDHYHHHDHDGRTFIYRETIFLYWTKLYLDDHHDHESHKKLFAGM